jgi:tRNA threonylcarbamoyladenosine biosynthesis protein TsaB
MGEGVVLALDTGSPEISVAVASGGSLGGLRTAAQRQASSSLLGMVDEALREAGATLADLAGVVALRGPGSFTGLRVGLATALGLHQAIGARATALPTLEMLAASVPGRGLTLALVRALRDEWFGQLFAGDSGHPMGEPRRFTLEGHLSGEAPERCVGFGLETLVEEPAAAGLELLAPATPLAAVAAIRGSRHQVSWDPRLLTEPLYLAAPAVSPPARPKRVLESGRRP